MAEEWFRVAPQILTLDPREELTKNFDFSGRDFPAGAFIQSIIDKVKFPNHTELLVSEVVQGAEIQITASGGQSGNLYYLLYRVLLNTGQKLVGVARVYSKYGGPQ